MAKNKGYEDLTKYIDTNLEDVMGDRFARYSKYIIQERALPDARDGLKPVQRRILYAMYHDGNTHDRPYRKSAKTVGIVIGNYHPHGDTSVYDAMVRMSQDWKVRLPLIDMHGNNGSIDDDPAAAMRYTEARLASVTNVMASDLDKDTVAFTPNFDDTDEEPTVLPVPFPVMLVNGATGIAAGYATNMPPHNLNEVVDATIYRLNNPSCTLDELMDIIQGPDFPTGGIVQGIKGIKDAFATGKGRVVVRARAHIQQEKSCQQIVITEIPYEVIKSDLVKKMDDIRIGKEVDGVLDVRDESDRDGLKIVVDVKKDADANMLLDYFYKNTDLQVYYNYNNVAIIDQRPVQVGLDGLLDAFINFRIEVVTRRSQFELNRMEARCHIIEGLMKAVSIIDEVIATIRNSKNKADAKTNLMEQFGFDDIQAEAIVQLRLYRLTNTDIVSLKEEFAELASKIEELHAILENESVMRALMIKELKAVKKEFGSERRSTIEDEVSEIQIDKANLISVETVMATISRDGYIKRCSLRSYGACEGQMTGLKEGDELIGCIECETTDTLLLFTSMGNYAYVPVYQIDDYKWKDLGSHLNKIAKIDPEDKIINAILVKDFNTNAYITTVSSDAQIKRSLVADFVIQRNSKVSSAMKLGKNETMVKAFMSYEGQQLVLVSRDGVACRYPVDEVSVMGVKTKGVKAQNIGKYDVFASACSVYTEAEELLFITASGGMKRIRIDDIPFTKRPAKGNMICKKIKSNPSVVIDVVPIRASDEVVFYDPSLHTMKGSEVPFKPTTTGFSNPVELDKGWYREKGIEECLLKDPSSQVSEAFNDEEVVEVERLSLFDLDSEGELL